MQEFILNLPNMEIIHYILKLLFIINCTYYTTIKITNTKTTKVRHLAASLSSIIIAIICGIVKELSNSFNGIIFLITLLTLVNIINIKNGIGYSILITIISLSINYSIFFISVIFSFIPNVIMNIRNDFISLIVIASIHCLLLYFTFKIKKFKNGILFLQKNMQNDYINLLILNISVTILFSSIILANSNLILTRSLSTGLIIFAIIMFVTIQKSLQLYYKQKLLIHELNETKEELKNKETEIKELEQENLNFSKTSHSLAHKQRALEYKLNKIIEKSEIAEEIDIKDRIENISKELYKEVEGVEIAKTGIPEIDDMLKYMQSECIKNKISFELQIIGNIHQMTNNIIEKQDLEILLADHIKNAIIAINHSENINKSILVKLGKIEKNYGVYIYDTGIEFAEETLENLGKKPSTTHEQEGGTGMGFMNTFDALRKYNASLTINEYGKPSNDNYTKSIKIKFDQKKEFKIKSYRNEIKKERID